jgi:hypothetical protein
MQDASKKIVHTIYHTMERTSSSRKSRSLKQNNTNPLGLTTLEIEELERLAQLLNNRTVSQTANNQRSRGQGTKKTSTKVGNIDKLPNQNGTLLTPEERQLQKILAEIQKRNPRFVNNMNLANVGSSERTISKNANNQRFGGQSTASGTKKTATNSVGNTKNNGAIVKLQNQNGRAVPLEEVQRMWNDIGRGGMVSLTPNNLRGMIRSGPPVNNWNEGERQTKQISVTKLAVRSKCLLQKKEKKEVTKPNGRRVIRVLPNEQQENLIDVFERLEMYLGTYYGASDVDLKEMGFKLKFSNGSSKTYTYTQAARDIPMYADLSTETIIKQVGKKDGELTSHPHHTLVALGQNIARLRRLGCKYMAWRKSTDKRRNCVRREDTNGPIVGNGRTFGRNGRNDDKRDMYSIVEDEKHITVYFTGGNPKPKSLSSNSSNSKSSTKRATNSNSNTNRYQIKKIWQRSFIKYTCKPANKCKWEQVEPKGRAVFVAKRVIDRMLDDNNSEPMADWTRWRRRSWGTMP